VYELHNNNNNNNYDLHPGNTMDHSERSEKVRKLISKEKRELSKEGKQANKMAYCTIIS